MTPEQALDEALEVGTRKAIAVAVSCPVCWSDPGEACVRTQGNTGPHPEREDKAERRGLMELIDSN